jgi:hypothetical protein
MTDDNPINAVPSSITEPGSGIATLPKSVLPVAVAVNPPPDVKVGDDSCMLPVKTNCRVGEIPK